MVRHQTAVAPWRCDCDCHDMSGANQNVVTERTLPESVEKALLALVDYTDLAYDPGVEPLRAAILAALRAERERALEEAAVAIETLRDNLPWSQGGTVTDSYAKTLVLGNLRNSAFTVRNLKSARQADGE